MARIKEAEAQATAGGVAQAGLEAELRAKETELARLAQELRRAQGVAERAEAAQREAAEAGGAQLQAAEQAAAALEEQLAARPSVEAHEKLRQQLRAMRRVVGGGDEDDEAAEGDGAVEALLTKKVRQLEQRISVLNASAEAAEAAGAASAKEVAQLRRAAQESAALIARL